MSLTLIGNATLSNNIYLLTRNSNEVGGLNITNNITDNFVINSFLTKNSNTEQVSYSWGGCNDRYEIDINKSNIQVFYNTSNLITSNYTTPILNSNEINIKYSLDTINLYVNRSNIINVSYSNLDYDEDFYFNITASNGTTQVEKLFINSFIVFTPPIEFRNSVKINGNIINSNLIQQSNNLNTLSNNLINTSNHLINRVNFNSNTIINTSNALISRINWNSNNMIQPWNIQSFYANSNNTFASNNFIQIRHGGQNDGSPNWLRLGVDGPALGGTGYINTERGGVAGDTPLSFRINNVEAMRINTNRTITINSNVSCCNISALNITTLSNQSAFSSNTAVWSSNNISSINFGSNNSVFSSNTSVWSSNSIITNSNHINSNINVINSNINVINSNLGNFSNNITNRINWNSNNLINRNSDILSGIYTFSNNHPFGLNSSLTLTANVSQNLSAEYIGEAFIKSITSCNIQRNVLSVVHNSNQLIRIKNDGGIIASNLTCCNIVVSNNVSANEFFENGVSLSNKYLSLSYLSNNSNPSLGAQIPIQSIYITQDGSSGGSSIFDGIGGLFMGIAGGAVTSFALNGISVGGNSLQEWGIEGFRSAQNTLTRTITDFTNRQIRGFTRFTTDMGTDIISVTGGPPPGLSGGSLTQYSEKIGLLSDFGKFGKFSISIDGDSNTITITNFNSNTSNITSNVVICDNNSFFMSNVAIGKSNPTSILDVNGTITASGLNVPIITTFSNNITTLSNQVYSFSNISSNVFNLSNQVNQFNWSNTNLINSNTQFNLLGSAITESNWIRLTDFQGSQTGTILYSNISQSNDLRLSFDMFGARPSNITTGADGLYVNFFSSNVAFQGTGYTVFFDNFNGGVGQNDALRILWNSSTIFDSNLGLSNYWDSSNWVNVNIALSNQTFNVNVNSNQRVFNFTDTTPRNKGDITNLYLSGRTGGFCNIHRVKDIQFNTVKDWRYYNNINNALIVNTSNSLVAVSNYLYNIIDPEATFASNIGVYSSNTIINTSNLLSNRITGLSNIIINNSNAIHPQATFSSNLAVYSSNVVNSLNSNNALFSSNLAVSNSNNLYPNANFSSNSINTLNNRINWNSNAVVWSSNNISAITFGSNTANWSSNNLMPKTGGNLLRFDNSVANRKLVLWQNSENDHQFYGLGINGGTLRFQVEDITNAYRFFRANNSTSSTEIFTINGNNNINSYGNVNVNNINSNTSRLEIQARGEGSSNTAELLFGTSFANNSNNGLKGALIFQGLNGWSRGNLHFCMEDTTSSLANNNATLSNSRMTLTSSGLLGIGTSNPTQRLDVNGSIVLNGNLGAGTTSPTQQLDVVGAGIFRNGNGGNGFTNNQILFGWAGGTEYKHCIKSRHHNGTESSTFGNAIDFLLWQQGQGNLDPGNRHIMSLTALGVGIGTSNPTNLQGAVLHLQTSNNLANTLNLQNRGGVGARAGLSFQTNSSTWYMNNDGAHLQCYGGSGFIGMITNSNFQIMDANAGNDLRFIVNASNANVGINVPNPTGQIHMNNRVMNRKIVLWDGTGNDHEFYGLGISSFEQQYRVPLGAVHRFVSSTSSTTSKVLATISSEGWSRFEGDLECSFLGIGGDATNRSIEVYDDLTRKTSTSTWQVSSDERIKTNIRDADINICYKNFKEIKLKAFSYNSNIKPFHKVKDKNTLGYIAQDVYKVFPKAVSIDDNMFGFSNFMSLDMDIINKCMYGALHKCIEKIEELEEEVKELKKNKKDNKW